MAVIYPLNIWKSQRKRRLESLRKRKGNQSLRVCLHVVTKMMIVILMSIPMKVMKMRMMMKMMMMASTYQATVRRHIEYRYLFEIQVSSRIFSGNRALISLNHLVL